MRKQTDYSKGWCEGYQAGLETRWSSTKAGMARSVLRAARTLFEAYRGEDQSIYYWKDDEYIDHHLYDLFLAVEAWEMENG